MKMTSPKIFLSLLLCTVLLSTLCLTVLALAGNKVTIPPRLNESTVVSSNDKATVDASNLAGGFLSVAYTGKKDVRIKVQISKTGGTTYTYNLNNTGTAETFPLTEGDGTYGVKVFENTTGTKYAQAFSTSVELTLRHEFLPFLYPNQYVKFTEDSQTTKKGADFTQSCTKDMDKLVVIYD